MLGVEVLNSAFRKFLREIHIRLIKLWRGWPLIGALIWKTALAATAGGHIPVWDQFRTHR